MLQVVSQYRHIPKPVMLLLAKSLVLLIVWKLLYLFVFLPKRILDKPLTYVVAKNTIRTLNFAAKGSPFSTTSSVYKTQVDNITYVEDEMDIFFNGRQLLAIADVCNGLELMVLYVGFIICFPAALMRKIRFILVGLVLIYLVNIVRCSCLTLIALDYPEYLDISHHFIFTFIVYLFIFWLWFLFSKKPKAYVNRA